MSTTSTIIAAFLTVATHLHAPADCKMPKAVLSTAIIQSVCQKAVTWGGWRAQSCYFNGGGSVMAKDHHTGEITAIAAGKPTIVFPDNFDPENRDRDWRLALHETGRAVWAGCLHREFSGEIPQEILDLEELPR